jgi:alkylhydroperoxidase family enzyme
VADPATGDTPRIRPLPLKEWPPAMRDALAAMTPPNPRHPVYEKRDDRPKALNALGVLAHHPALTHAFHVFNGHLQFSTTLSLRERELLVLRVAVVRRAEYEWAQHIVVGLDVGLSDDDIARVAEGPDAPGWSPLEQAMLRAVDELVADATISDTTWRVLAEHLDEQQLMDLVFTVGCYDVVAMAFRTFRIPLDEDLRAWSERKHGSHF